MCHRLIYRPSDDRIAQELESSSEQETPQDDPQSTLSKNEQSPVFPGFATSFDLLQTCTVTPTGSEHVANLPGKMQVRSSSGAKSGALLDDSTTFDPALSLIVQAWPDLTEQARKEILAVVRREGNQQGS